MLDIRRRDRIIVLFTMVLLGVIIILLSQSTSSQHNLLVIAFAILAVAIFISVALDHNCKTGLRIALFSLVVIAMIMTIIGFFLTEDKMNIQLFTIFLGSFDIASALAKGAEAFFILKEKNKMGLLFLVSSIFELVIGIMMIIEKNATLELHAILIGSNLAYEGVIKFLNDLYEVKKGIHAE